jgi:hypothetical protein
MSTTARAIIRAKVNPNVIGQKFKVNAQGASPTIYRGAGVDFWFLFVDDSGNPMDISNVSDLSILAKVTTWQTLVTVTSESFNTACTLAQWEAGSAAHVKVTMLGTATNITAGTYDLTLKAHTTDDAVDLDCFGISTLQVLDVGLTDAAVSPAPDETIEGVVNALLSGYLTAIGQAGQPRWEVSPNGQWRIAQTIDDNGQPSTLIEQV